jgi:zinc protease
MKKVLLRMIYIISILLISSGLNFAFAQETPIPNLYHYQLDNGLELFIMENDIVPLTYIEIAVKAGGIAQTKETAGLFHLYEHMMFKGNSKYPTAAAVQRAINDMGVASWNGSTGAEYVNYFFTVPSHLTKEGLEFWSAAIREPLLDSKELENEKKVVISEIEGYFSDPNWIYQSAIQKNLFPDYPWRLDPGGTRANIENATVEAVQNIQNTYYVPNNTALFVGGDVDHKEVLKMVKEVYGNWKKASDPWAKPLPPQRSTPSDTTRYLVIPHNQISPQIAQVEVYFRAPDTALDTESTYAADVFGSLAANPKGRFKNTLVSNQDLGIPSSEYIGASYYTQKDSGRLTFITVMLSPEAYLPQRAKLLEQTIRTEVIDPLITDPSYFSAEEYASVKQRSQDSRLLEAETSSGLLSNLRFWWASASVDYYFSYIDKLSSVGSKDIAAFFTKYGKDKPAIVTVLVNPEVYQAQKIGFDAAGFELVNKDNAFWWK